MRFSPQRELAHSTSVHLLAIVGTSILASKNIATIANELNRTREAIRRRATKLKLPLKLVTVGLKAKGNPK